MIACLDSYYAEESTRTACVLFEGWTDVRPVDEVVKDVVEPARAYVPGRFYQRELPVLLGLLREVAQPIATVVIDGYVWLDGAQSRKGLGAHLYDALNQQVAVVGVAKKYFKDCQAAEVYRGKSKQPLYVTAAGMEIAQAAACVQQMTGAHRMPLLLKRVDYLSRHDLATSFEAWRAGQVE